MNANLIRSAAMAVAVVGMMVSGQGAEAREPYAAPDLPEIECCESGNLITERMVDRIREVEDARRLISAHDKIPYVIGGISPHLEGGTTVLGRWTP